MAESVILRVYAETPALQADAVQLAQQLGLEYCNVWHKGDWLLKVTEAGLALQPGLLGDVSVDFCHGKLGYRVGHQSRARSEMVVKAVGVKGLSAPTVLDATAGLGRDSFILASVGCCVTMLERNPVVYQLLRDGLQRALQDEKLQHWLAQRLQLHAGDILCALPADVPQKFDVVYLDPMFPSRQKSALVKKEMQAFHQIVGADVDSEQLLAAAHRYASKKVVVKRPASAPPLAQQKPSYQVSSKHNRFDVYILHT